MGVFKEETEKVATKVVPRLYALCCVLTVKGFFMHGSAIQDLVIYLEGE